MSKLSKNGFLLAMDADSGDAAPSGPVDDLAERNAMDFAKRAVLDVLEAGRKVDAACELAAGVECTAVAISCSSSSLCDCASSESSKGGNDGNDGISLFSMASIRLHIRDGVSSIAAMVRFCCGLRMCQSRAAELDSAYDHVTAF